SVVAEMIFYLEPNKQAEAVKLIEESSNKIASRFPFIVCEIFIVRLILFLKPWLRMKRSVVAEMIFYLEPNKQAEAVKLIEESSNKIASRLILFLKPWLRMKRYGTIDSLF
nr:hypothetical protein [Tanacetum cinerariifolium]